MRARAFDRLRGGAISVLIASALALHACSKEGSALPGGKSKADQAGVPVVTAQVVRKIMPAKLQAIGNVEAYTTVAVKSRIDGQIIAVRFQDGQDVRARTSCCSSWTRARSRRRSSSCEANVAAGQGRR